MIKRYPKWYYEAAEKLIKVINKDDIPNIKKEIEEDGEEWIIPYHFRWGMAIRNELRKLGYLDQEYGNLDDHYAKIIEISVNKYS